MTALPNIRKFFIPDPYHIIAEADLAGADAQVVAWEANDESLKAAFRAGLNVHAENSKAMFGELAGPDGLAKPYYFECKTAVHATNYYAQPKGLAHRLDWPILKAKEFQSRWFDLHPSIPEWQSRVNHDLHTTRQAKNKFGFRMLYFDRVEDLLPKALAWIPQSTIAHTCQTGALQLYNNIPWLKLLMQVHDSIVFQFPHNKMDCLDEIKHHLAVTIPYDDPLTIPWTLKLSSKSWGDAKAKQW